MQLLSKLRDILHNTPPSTDQFNDIAYVLFEHPPSSEAFSYLYDHLRSWPPHIEKAFYDENDHGISLDELELYALYAPLFEILVGHDEDLSRFPKIYSTKLCGQIPHLRLVAEGMGARGTELRPALRKPLPQHIHTFELWTNCYTTPPIFTPLWDGAPYPHIRHLHFELDESYIDDISHKIHSGVFPALRSLTLHRTIPLPSGVPTCDLSALRNNPHLETFRLASVHIPEASMRDTFQNAFPPQLHALCLHNCKQLDASVNILFRNPLARQLQHLSLSNNLLTRGNLKELSQSACMHSLKHLSLAHCALENRSINQLTKAKNLHNLATLDLSHNAIKDPTKVLQLLPNSTRVNLSNNPISNDLRNTLQTAHPNAVF